MTDSPSLSQIRSKMRSLIPVLGERYQVASIALFGSYVREENRPGSDLDVLVTFDETPSLLRFVDLENYLSEALGIKVDLVMKDSLKPKIAEHILTEAVSP